MFNLDLTIVAFYLFITLLIGIIKGRSNTNLKDYSVADRNYPTSILVATVFATVIGGDSTLGMAEKIFGVGIVYFFVFLGGPINKVIIGKFVAPRMERFAGLISVGEIMESFYGKPGKVITAISGSILCIGSIAAQVSSIGYLLNLFLGISLPIGILIGAGIIVLYSAFGGIKAVTATDIIQFAILIVVIPVICNIALAKVGGFSGLLNQISEDHIRVFPKEDNPLKYVFLFIIFCIPFLDPSVIQRLLIAKNTSQISQAMYITAFISVPFYFLIASASLAIFIIKPDLNPNQTLPFFINEMLPSGLKGAAIAGILAVIMSTGDSYLNTASISIVNDLIKPFSKKKFTGKEELNLARLVTFMLGILAIIAAICFDSIMQIIISSLNSWGPIILVPLFSGIFGIIATKKTFIISTISSILLLVIWKFIPTSIDSLFPAMITNAIVFYYRYFVIDKKNMVLQSDNNIVVENTEHSSKKKNIN